MNDKPIAAYFVGGPEDMTKRIMRTLMEFIRVPEMPSSPAFHDPEEKVEKAEFATHLYRARAELRPWGQPMTYIVYEYMGRE